MERVSIALVSDWYPPRIGGVERQIHGLAHALQARGHDVRVLTSTRGGPGTGTVPVVRLDLPIFAGGDVAWPVPELVRQLRDWLGRSRVDVVHAHGMFSPMAHAAVLVADRLGVASVFTSHSLICPGLRPLARLIFLGFARRADIVSAVSQAAAADARLVSGRGEVTVLSNGIDLAAVRHSVRDKGGTGNDVRILSVMRLEPKKNPGDLVAAVPRVLSCVPDPSRIRFVIVGDGSERPRLERQARELGVADRIAFVGYRQPDEVRQHLAEAQIFASPVRNEAFGLALLEARAAGLPIVSMAGGGVGEIVSAGRHGFLTATMGEFVGALARLAADEALRRTMAGATVVGLEPFGWDAVVERHVETYRRAIEVRGGRRMRP